MSASSVGFRLIFPTNVSEAHTHTRTLPGGVNRRARILVTDALDLGGTTPHQYRSVMIAVATRGKSTLLLTVTWRIWVVIAVGIAFLCYAGLGESGW
jgi:hypothetical protein